MGGGGSRGGSSLPRDSNGEGASVLGEPCRTLEVASSVNSTCLVWGADGGWHLGSSARPPSQVSRVGGQPWQPPAELYSPGSPCLLSGILQQPWTKESRTNYRPTKSSCCCSSTSYFTPICPAHSQALRPAEGTNLMVLGTHSQPGTLLGHWCLPPTHSPVRVPRWNLPPGWHWSPGAFGSRDPGVSLTKGLKGAALVRLP